MSKVEIRKACPGAEKILAYILTESWKAAFCHILAEETLKRCTRIEKAEKMYENVLQNPYIHINLMGIREKYECQKVL